MHPALNIDIVEEEHCQGNEYILNADWFVVIFLLLS